ncbi:MAG TPA: HAMP domain-containing sensor histidine kinase, partial [Chthoniobacterales bacterium]
HELRTPLTPVLIWAAGTVDQGDLPAEIDEGLRMICRNIELEARLIDDLLDLTRINRGKLQLHRCEADVHELLRHSFGMVQSEMDARELKLEVRLAAQRPRVFADPARLQQVFWNVLRNASKFSQRAGTIFVRTFNPTPERLTIEITDEGIGIDPQFLAIIFDAFEQVGARPEGLGLGLAISKAIVEMHDGTIRAHSAGAGSGASLVIELPAGV